MEYVEALDAGVPNKLDLAARNSLTMRDVFVERQITYLYLREPSSVAQDFYHFTPIAITSWKFSNRSEFCSDVL
jgi:hypothetical protein